MEYFEICISQMKEMKGRQVHFLIINAQGKTFELSLRLCIKNDDKNINQQRKQRPYQAAFLFCFL